MLIIVDRSGSQVKGSKIIDGVGEEDTNLDDRQLSPR